MYQREESVGFGRYAARVVVTRYPSRDVVSRKLSWQKHGGSRYHLYGGTLNLDREVADRFVRSVRHAWDLATGAARAPEGLLEKGATVFIGRFPFDIQVGPSPSVRALEAHDLTLSSSGDLTELCAVVDSAVEVADRIEHAPDFQLDRLPAPEPPEVSSWIQWPASGFVYANASSPSDLSNAVRRHSTATHSRANYPDPDGCDTCWSEADELMDYHAHLRNLQVALSRRERPTTPDHDGHLDPP